MKFFIHSHKIQFEIWLRAYNVICNVRYNFLPLINFTNFQKLLWLSYQLLDWSFLLEWPRFRPSSPLFVSLFYSWFHRHGDTLQIAHQSSHVPEHILQWNHHINKWWWRWYVDVSECVFKKTFPSIIKNVSTRKVYSNLCFAEWRKYTFGWLKRSIHANRTPPVVIHIHMKHFIAFNLHYCFTFT